MKLFLSKIYEHRNEKKYVILDIDKKELFKEVLTKVKEQEIDIYCIIETRGGYHMILEKNKLTKDHFLYIK